MHILYTVHQWAHISRPSSHFPYASELIPSDCLGTATDAVACTGLQFLVPSRTHLHGAGWVGVGFCRKQRTVLESPPFWGDRMAAISFKGRHFRREMILQGVRWYLAYPLSYRDLEEMMQERSFDQTVQYR